MDVSILPLFLAGALLGYWVAARRGKRSTVVSALITFDGSQMYLEPAQRNEDGALQVKDTIYEPGAVYLVSSSLERIGVTLYVLRADALRLVEYRQFNRMAKSIIKGRMFSPGGDLMRLMYMSMAGAAVAAALFVIFNTNSQAALLADVKANQEQITKILSSPLVVQK